MIERFNFVIIYSELVFSVAFLFIWNYSFKIVWINNNLVLFEAVYSWFRLLFESFLFESSVNAIHVAAIELLAKLCKSEFLQNKNNNRESYWKECKLIKSKALWYKWLNILEFSIHDAFCSILFSIFSVEL